MQTCQIVGYKNSGKTTVMKYLIAYFSKKGLKVGSLKHHGHGGEPALIKNTDNYQHFAAGASVSLVQGETNSQIILPNLDLTELIRLFTLLQINLLFVEGFKKADFPKIVLLKCEEDKSLLNELSSIIAVGSWNEGLLKGVNYPAFPITNMEAHVIKLADYILDGRC
ncbi:molybdopterin-guanine dinucleotide biosynthesis protein B [Virgibacillus dakarensis]|nr:molybdopterin-guanine dinucleotide biosynthesis protein B [Virgibacillus dakarensis]